MADGPTAATCAAVDDREQQHCARCGRYVDGGSRHHRKLRRHGDHSVANLVLLCGSGTTGCHGWVHSHVADSYSLGWLVHSWHESNEVPVLTVQGWVTLSDEGQYNTMTRDQALARRIELGLAA